VASREFARVRAGIPLAEADFLPMNAQERGCNNFGVMLKPAAEMVRANE
jgi:hypothetical protein